MPSKAELAKKSGLSRQTIYKHLKEYASHPLFEEYLKQFQFLSNKILAKVAVYAIQGDMRAAKLYLEFVSGMKTISVNNQTIQQQNNFIQINGLTLCQEQLKDLNADQLKTLEETIKQITRANGPSPIEGNSPLV